MPVTIDNGQQAALYPAEIVHNDPAFKAGQVVPNCYGSPYVVAGLRYEVKYGEEWVPTGPATEDGDLKYIVHSTEWEYLLVKLDARGSVYEWGWVKQSKIEQEIKDREWKPPVAA